MTLYGKLSGTIEKTLLTKQLKKKTANSNQLRKKRKVGFHCGYPTSDHTYASSTWQMKCVEKEERRNKENKEGGDWLEKNVTLTNKRVKLREWMRVNRRMGCKDGRQDDSEQVSCKEENVMGTNEGVRMGVRVRVNRHPVWSRVTEDAP